MLGYLHPDNIYDDFKANKLTRQETIDLLFSLREKTNSSYIKVRCLEILDKIETETPEIVKYASILVKDKFPEVRSRALKLMLKNSPKTALILLNSLIPREDSFFVLISVYRTLNISKEDQFKKLIHEVIKKIADFHGVVFEEGEFILDLYMASNSDEFIDLHLDIEYKELYISNHLSDLFYIYGGCEEWITRFIIKNSHIIYLDCSLMELTELPKSIEMLSRLRYLKLNGNYLEDLPEAISRLCWLKYIELNGNKFLTLPNVVSNLKYIKMFHFECNYELKYLPNWIIDFARRIFAKNYILQGVNPKEAPILGIFQLLLGYKLEKTDLEEFAFGEGGCLYKINKNGNVTGIYIQGNHWDNPVLPLIPEQISELKFLKELYLSSNKIKEIPELIGKLTSLKYLNLRSNKITFIPNSLNNLSSLESLNLEFNRITEIKNIKSLKNLKKIDFGYNKITSIKELKYLSNLIELRLDGNPISNWNGLENLRNLKKLSFTGRYGDESWEGLKDISNIIGLKTLNNLEELDLTWNNLGEIKGLENLLNLKKLNLRRNQINEMKGLENLLKLNYLNLDYNPIPEDLIKSLGGFKIIGGQKVIKYPQKLVKYCRRQNKT